ncbi:MAG: hypothetical protein LUH07_15540 [Lachnospiraceae bacterium]|nr:hypothetical protein [Lachnospiraceae bacterium]
MKQYTKPEFYVEEFHPNVAVAACRTDLVDTYTTIPAQPITCYRMNQTTDYLFTSDVTACKYQPDAIKYLATGTYSTSDLSSSVSTINGSGSSLYVPDDGNGGSYVVVWGNGNHYGIATDEIIELYTNSY